MMIPRVVAAIVASAGVAAADPVKVTVDIAPLHGLVSQVMGDIGTPDLLLPPNVSPHHFSMRPSQAKAMSEADVVFWISESLTPWLHGPMENLAETAISVEMMETAGTVQYEFRESAVFDHGDHDGHDDHDDHKGHDDHAGHDDHDDHKGHDDHEGHDDHDDHKGHDDHAGHDDHDDHSGHAHEGVDPHGWLSPKNAEVWLGVIAETLSKVDPENAATYAANAKAAQEQIHALEHDIEERLHAFEGRSYIVFHDAYQYFENQFHLTGLGAISLGDATAPSPARLRELQEAIAENDVRCVFSEPQLDDRLVDTVFNDTGTAIVRLDPLGSTLTPGADFYPQLLTDLAASFETCLK